MRLMRKDLQRGITVLELLIVVVLIGVLAMVANTRVLAAKDRVAVSAAEQDIQTLRKALALYAADYDCYPERIDNFEEMQRRLQDPNGNPYVDFPSMNNFSWVSYELVFSDFYVFRVQAKNHSETFLTATPIDVTAGGQLRD